MILVRAAGQYVELYRREPDPAGGRADHVTIARVSIEEAETIVESLQSALPEARKAARKHCADVLRSAEDALRKQTSAVKSLQSRIRELRRGSRG